MDNSTLSPSFDASDYDALCEPARAVVGQAFRYVMALGTALEQGQRAFSRLEDSRHRMAWRKGVALVKGPDRVKASRMIADAMEAVKVLRANPPQRVH